MFSLLVAIDRCLSVAAPVFYRNSLERLYLEGLVAFGWVFVIGESLCMTAYYFTWILSVCLSFFLITAAFIGSAPDKTIPACTVVGSLTKPYYTWSTTWNLGSSIGNNKHGHPVHFWTIFLAVEWISYVFRTIFIGFCLLSFTSWFFCLSCLFYWNPYSATAIVYSVAVYLLHHRIKEAMKQKQRQSTIKRNFELRVTNTLSELMNILCNSILVI